MVSVMVVFLEERMKHIDPVGQGQLQAIAQRAQIGGAGGEAVHTLVGAPNGFFLGARVVHHKRVQVHGHVGASQGTKVHGASCIFG